MTTNVEEIVEYPIVKRNDLTVDALYRDLQQRGPIRIQLPYGEPAWLATTYADVKTVYGDRRFGKELGLTHDVPRMHEMNVNDPDLLVNMDPPRQTRLRRLALTAFAAPQIKTMREWTTGVVNDDLDRLVEQGPGADFIETVAWTVPLTVLTSILGVPRADAPNFRRWVDEMVGADTEIDDRMRAADTMTGYVRDLIAERRERETDDLLSVLVHARDDDDQLTEDELVSLSMTLFLGGFETTAAQLGSTVFALMTHRHLWQELLDDPALLPAALEELWRWIPSFRFGSTMVRWANEDVELSGGVVIPRGDAVVAEHTVGNRDETVFPHGWELDFHRVDPQPHLSLAWGVHRCLGAHLAHLEVEATLEQLLARFPTLELAVAPDDVPWSESTFLRSAVHLPVSW
jgi:cytochrome P450